MPRGKPWTAEEEKQLKDLLDAGHPLSVVAERLHRKPTAVSMKIKRLGLEVVVTESRRSTTTTEVKLPEELPSVEEALRMLAGALKRSCQPGLDKVEVQRLQVVATLARTYKDILADYLDYRRVEAELLELRQKYEELAKRM
jgi:aspartate aminotransferase-like enzyme